MRGGIDAAERRGARGAIAIVLALFGLGIGAALAEEAPASGYGDAAKAAILQLLSGRAFKPEHGCEPPAPCTRLLAQLNAGKFTVVEPLERSNALDMPRYLALRRRCPSLDLAHVKFAPRSNPATRNFAIYSLNLPRASGKEILIFRGQHYVALDAGRGANGPTAPWPGAYTAIELPHCRMLSTALAEDGDHFARHNKVDEADYATELLKIGDRYLVLNLVPIAGIKQPKETWWYTLELWDLGPRADADLRHQRHVYSFGAKPAAPPPAAALPPPR